MPTFILDNQNTSDGPLVTSLRKNFICINAAGLAFTELAMIGIYYQVSYYEWHMWFFLVEAAICGVITSQLFLETMHVGWHGLFDPHRYTTSVAAVPQLSICFSGHVQQMLNAFHCFMVALSFMSLAAYVYGSDLRYVSQAAHLGLRYFLVSLLVVLLLLRLAARYGWRELVPPPMQCARRRGPQTASSGHHANASAFEPASVSRSNMRPSASAGVPVVVSMAPVSRAGYSEILAGNDNTGDILGSYTRREEVVIDTVDL